LPVQHHTHSGGESGVPLKGFEALVDGSVVTKTLADLSVINSKVKDLTLTEGKIVPNEYQFTVDIPVLVDAASVAADALGTPSFAHSEVRVRAESIKHLKSAQLILDYAWAATADGTIQLYDSTALVVIAETAALVGGEASPWLELAASGLVAGNSMAVRGNVTVAGAAGETATVYKAILRLVLGIS